MLVPRGALGTHISGSGCSEINSESILHRKASEDMWGRLKLYWSLTANSRAGAFTGCGCISTYPATSPLKPEHLEQGGGAGRAAENAGAVAPKTGRDTVL